MGSGVSMSKIAMFQQLCSGGIMKKVALVTLILFSTLLWAEMNPDWYPINVHVVSSYYVTSAWTAQKLSVLIEGKKYELTAEASRAGLLAIGDYKARLTKNEQKTTYESNQEYEFIFPDKTTRKFRVTGQTE
jgi:hypothetical protein